MNVEVVEISGRFFRVADPDWSNPLDASYAAAGSGQRWNPAGVACLYLNHDEQTAHANVARLFDGKPYGPEDLDPSTAPLLIDVNIPAGRAADAFTDAGLAALGLPTTYPVDQSGTVITHDICQPIGRDVHDADLDGVDCRSAAVGGTRELAWFPHDTTPTAISTRAFDSWW